MKKEELLNVTLVDVKLKTREKLRKVAHANNRSMSGQGIVFIEHGLENHPDIMNLTKDEE